METRYRVSILAFTVEEYCSISSLPCGDSLFIYPFHTRETGYAIIVGNMKSEDDVSIDDYRGLGEFRYQIRRFVRFSEQVARAAGIEPQQHQLLLAIKGLPEGMRATISNLAERMQLQHHSTVELVDRLEERGLVERCRDEEDQRRVLVRLTQEGEEALNNLSRHTLTELRSIGPGLVSALNRLMNGANAGEHDGVNEIQERENGHDH